MSNPSNVLFGKATPSWVLIFVAMLFVMGTFWAVQASSVTFDLRVEGYNTAPNLSLFQRLHWLWAFLAFAPAIYIGAANVCSPLLSGAVAYGMGVPLGWCAAQLEFVLSNSALKSTLPIMLAQSVLFGAAFGAAVVGLVQVCKCFIRWVRRGANPSAPP